MLTQDMKEALDKYFQSNKKLFRFWRKDKEAASDWIEEGFNYVFIKRPDLREFIKKQVDTNLFGMIDNLQNDNGFKVEANWDKVILSWQGQEVMSMAYDSNYPFFCSLEKLKFLEGQNA